MRLKVLASGSKGNCYILQGEEKTLLLECGINYKDILKGLDFNLIDVAGCLISHEHKDHSKAIKDIMLAGITTVTSDGTAKSLNAYEHMFYRVQPVKNEQLFNLEKFSILPFKVQHDAADPLGFLIHHSEMGKLLFITDSYYCEYKFKGLNHIMIECNYSKKILNERIENGEVHPALGSRLIKSHFSLENVKEFLKANDLREVKDIILLHLSDGNSDGPMFKEEIQKLTGKPVYIANKGLEIEL